MHDNQEAIELKKVIEQISENKWTQRTRNNSETRTMDAVVDLLDASIQYWQGGRKQCNQTRKRRAYRVKTLHIYNDSSVPIFIAAYGIEPESNQRSPSLFGNVNLEFNMFQNQEQTQASSMQEYEISSKRELQIDSDRLYFYKKYRSIVLYIYRNVTDTEHIIRHEFTDSEDWYFRDSSIPTPSIDPETTSWIRFFQ